MIIAVFCHDRPLRSPRDCVELEDVEAARARDATGRSIGVTGV
jgi:hypothetical protein